MFIIHSREHWNICHSNKALKKREKDNLPNPCKRIDCYRAFKTELGRDRHTRESHLPLEECIEILQLRQQKASEEEIKKLADQCRPVDVPLMEPKDLNSDKIHPLLEIEKEALSNNFEKLSGQSKQALNGISVNQKEVVQEDEFEKNGFEESVSLIRDHNFKLFAKNIKI